MDKHKIDELLDQAIKGLFQDDDYNTDDPNLEPKYNTSSIQAYEQIEKQNEQDGLLAIEQGKVKLYPPESTGNWPKITPDENVIVKINGQIINDITVVKNESEVEIAPQDKPLANDFQFHFSEDSVELILETKFKAGKKYQILDNESTHNLYVKAQFIEDIPPKPIDKNNIYEKLFELGISKNENVVELFHHNIDQAASQLHDTKTVIAKGKPMISPTDGWIEYMFKTEERIKNNSDESDRVNFFDQGEFNSVEIGETLAVLHPPIPGSAGLTVTGKVIEPPQPQSPKIHAGNGVELIDNGKIAVATTSGRPTISKTNVITVIPELIISQNVDINTGHIKFRGDVKIYGDVKDGLNVNSGGSVHISGSVFNGNVYGDKGVYINNNLIGSFVSAGGRSAEYRKLLPLIKRLRDIINTTVTSYVKLIDNPKFSSEDLQKKGVGLLIKQILEMKFSDLEKTLQKLENSLPKESLGDESNLSKAVKFMNSKLIGHGPMNISSIDELNKLKTILSNIIDIIQENTGKEGDVIFKNGQNAKIEATGEVTSIGNGIYHTDIIAGETIMISGFCRGGTLFASNKISVAELGSNTGVKVSVEVNEDGRILADTVFPEVLFKIGDIAIKSQEKHYKVSYTIESLTDQ